MYYMTVYCEHGEILERLPFFELDSALGAAARNASLMDGAAQLPWTAATDQHGRIIRLETGRTSGEPPFFEGADPARAWWKENVQSPTGAIGILIEHSSIVYGSAAKDVPADGPAAPGH